MNHNACRFLYARNRVLKGILFSLLIAFCWCSAGRVRADTTDTNVGRPPLVDTGKGGSSSGNNSPVTQTPVVKPRFRGVRATGGIERGVVSGGWVNLDLTRSLPEGADEPKVTLTGLGDDDEALAVQNLPVKVQNVFDTLIVISVPDSLPRGDYQVAVFVPGADSLLRRPQNLHVEPLINIIAWSLLPIAILTLFLAIVTRRPSATGVKGLKLLFLEPQNMTYSLSRVQFLLWSAAISWGYMFLFFARGLVEDTWTFPPLTGFIYTFLISLGTLIGAQVTTATKGAKGSGSLHPSIGDLIVHGGVPALERVQQILWTLIAIGIFLVSIVKNYAHATGLPEIPQELLVLMGISSAGYLAGKAVRKPGPIIQQVRATPGSLQINIIGEHLSREAILWIDGVQRMEKPTVVVADQETPMEFAKELQIKIEDMTSSQWLASPHLMLITNTDGQRCEWHTTPKITKVTESTPDAGGKVTLTVETEYIPTGSVLDVTGATKESVTRDPLVPNNWIVVVTPTDPTVKPYEKLQIPYGKNQMAEYLWRPAAPESDPTAAAKKVRDLASDALKKAKEMGSGGEPLDLGNIDDRVVED